MKPWLERLQRRFSPRRIRLGSESVQALAGGESDALLCFVGRELCLFTTVDAGKAPEKQREAFVALAVQRAAPFPDPDFGLAWTGPGHAAVWYWSRSRIGDLLGGQPARRIRFVPEALHVGAAREDDAELLALAHGVEGRLWKQGRLVASRWWPTAPEANAWRTFLRSAGMVPGNADQAPPVPLPTPLTQRRWNAHAGKSANELSLSGLAAYAPHALRAVGLGLLLLYAFQIGNMARSQIDVWRARAAAQDLDASLERILSAREHADRDLAAIQQLLALRTGRPQLQLLAEATRLLPGNDWQILRWSQPTPERVELTLRVPGANPEQMVSTWEASTLFTGVTTELGRNDQIVVRAQVVPASYLGSGAAAP